MKSRRVKFLLFTSLLLFCLSLSSCKSTVYGEELEGINVIFTPFVAIWTWFFKVFTPHYWAFITNLFSTLPQIVSWLIGLLACIGGGIIYLLFLLIVVALDLVIGLVLALIWIIAAILNGIFKWV